MSLRSLQSTASGQRTHAQEAAGALPFAVVEAAFESFVVMLWQRALAQDSAGGWARACEQLNTLRLFLDRTGLDELAATAADLVDLAACHAGDSLQKGAEARRPEDAPVGRAKAC